MIRLRKEIFPKRYFDRTTIKANGASLRVMITSKISSLFLVIITHTFRSKSSIVSPPPLFPPFSLLLRGGTTKSRPATMARRNRSVELTRKSPCSWWTRWLRQTLRSRRMSPCTEEQKRTPSDSDVEVYRWHGRNRPCPIWALAPRPTLLWPPMWDISIPFKRLHGCCRRSSAYNCHIFHPCI